MVERYNLSLIQFEKLMNSRDIVFAKRLSKIEL